ncbi:putative anthocyanidin reductase isoform X2 [Lolium rigidum]|uniref:putative anthocyanidin reductase isoform X2 n=1 Tax=Lolium rigidum TaxID=89674 RepID=UPI001F5D83B3|nr:putative anthocyanidin reductase isoform X2 [Lolium rigidum]
MSCRVCVTGAAGYIGSWLVRKLLDRGCAVHATIRNIGDEKKTALLKGLPGAAERLTLFQADIYDAVTFEPAIQGCDFVFLVATPLMHNTGSSKYKDTTEAIVDATHAILEQCERSKTVRRVIHTGSVVASAPLREDGEGYKEFMSESCWTPLVVPYGHSNEFLDAYVSSKTLSDKELLKYNDSSSSTTARSFDVVVLLCGLVGGDTILPYTPDSMNTMLSPLTGVEVYHKNLRFLQSLLGSVPLVHVDDVCEAHIFCMERFTDIAGGRYLCPAAYPNMQDILEHYAGKHPQLKLMIKEVVGEGVRVQANTKKLMELGFKYKYGAEEVLDGSLECGKRLGLL